MKMSVHQQSVFQRYYSEKHLAEFYPQDGGESQLASKLRHCHPRYWLSIYHEYIYDTNNG